MNDPISANLDSLLDSTLDDLEDLPSFEPYPAGAHRVLATMEAKDIGGKPCVELSFKLLETMELADPSAKEPKAGDTANTLYMLDNEYGRGNLKKVAIPLGTALGVTSIREVVDQCKEVECVIITGLRKDKNDPDKRYLQVKELQVV